MHPPEVRAAVCELTATGLDDSEIARRLGLPRSTVRGIHAPRYLPREPAGHCPRCWRRAKPMRFGPAEYAELLGFYLGDGHVVRAGRTHRLRLSLDARHGEVVAVARGLLARVFPRNPVSVAHLDGGATAVLSVYSRHLPCLLPQHGVGKKHDRPIVLEPWQEELVAQAPWSLLRGLLWSDGCFFINRTGPYSYLSASFSNRSADIVALFCRTCDQVGVRYTTTGCSVRICRRSSVADLAAFVGTKR